MEDRRDRPRVAMSVDLEIGDDQGWIQAQSTKDLSMSGVQICSDRNFAVGTELKIRLNLQDTFAGTKTEVVSAVVMRSQQNSAGQWCLGLNFGKLSSDASIFLYNLIKYHRS